MQNYDEQGWLELRAILGELSSYLRDPLPNKERVKIVGDNLLLLRRRSGLSQKDVCLLLDCAPQTYCGYEKGLHEPALETLFRLAELYGCSLDRIFGREAIPGTGLTESDIAPEDENEYLREMVRRMDEMQERLTAMEKEVKRSNKSSNIGD